jgi:hypothetical protein
MYAATLSWFISLGTEMYWFVNGVLSIIMYSPGFVVDCSNESAGREKSKGYSFVVSKVSNGNNLNGRLATPLVDVLDELEELPAGVDR